MVSSKDSTRPRPQSTTGTVSSGRLVERAEAARLLGVSVSTLRRREGADLKPIVDAHGVHMFEEAELRSVMVTVRRRQSIQAFGASSGDVAADVFEMLDLGEHPVEIVKRLRIAPDVVAGLLEQWAAMRGGFIVSATQALELARMARERTPPGNASTALAQIRERLVALTQMRSGSAKCSVCGDNTASLCESCIPATIGKVGSFDVRIERRAAAHGGGELRVCAGLYWNGHGGGGGNVGQVRSDWYPEDDVANTEISDLVRGIERSLVAT